MNLPLEEPLPDHLFEFERTKSMVQMEVGSASSAYNDPADTRHSSPQFPSTHPPLLCGSTRTCPPSARILTSSPPLWTTSALQIS